MVGPMKLDRAAIDIAYVETAILFEVIKKALEGDKEACQEMTKYDIDLRLVDLYLGNINNVNATHLVSSFVNMWNNEYHRDMMSRTLPGDNTKKIVVCGERTCGDGPEDDSAWGVTKKAMFLGIPELLGIE
jgi:hypothetical protein